MNANIFVVWGMQRPNIDSLNDSKTEYIMFWLEQNLSEFTNTQITLGEYVISQSDSVKSISVDMQISSTCWSAWFYMSQMHRWKWLFSKML